TARTPTSPAKTTAKSRNTRSTPSPARSRRCRPPPSQPQVARSASQSPPDTDLPVTIRQEHSERLCDPSGATSPERIFGDLALTAACARHGARVVLVHEYQGRGGWACRRGSGMSGLGVAECLLLEWVGTRTCPRLTTTACRVPVTGRGSARP